MTTELKSLSFSLTEVIVGWYFRHSYKADTTFKLEEKNAKLNKKNL